MSPKKTTDELIESLAVAVHDGFTEVRTELKQMRGELNEIKTDVQGLKTDVRELKQGMAHLTHQVDELRSDFSLESVQVSDHERRITHLEKAVEV